MWAPDVESVQEQHQARLDALGQHGTAVDSVSTPDVGQRTFEALEAIDQRLRSVQIMVVVIGAIVLLGLVAPLWFGWIHIESR